MTNFRFGDISEKIIGAAMRVHNTLGGGFQELISRRALGFVNDWNLIVSLTRSLTLR